MYRIHYTPLRKNILVDHIPDLRAFEAHKHRIRTMKSKLRIDKPRNDFRVIFNGKKLQILRNRLLKIDQDNKFLMKRIIKIKKGHGPYYQTEEPRSMSINCYHRQVEMGTVAYRNLLLHRRIIECTTEYNRNKLNDEFLMHQKYKANIEKYPPNWRELIKNETNLKKTLRQEFLDKEERMKKREAIASKKKKKIHQQSKKATLKKGKSSFLEESETSDTSNFADKSENTTSSSS